MATQEEENRGQEPAANMAQESSPKAEFLRPNQVCEMLNISIASFYRALRRPDFPQPVVFTPGGFKRWVAAEVAAWANAAREPKRQAG